MMCRDDMEPVLDCDCDYCVGYNQALLDTPGRRHPFDRNVYGIDKVRDWFIPLRQAAKCEGSYEFEKVISHFEEYLTGIEYDEVKSFLEWLKTNNKTFGHNLPEVFNEFKESVK
jgi:hypothetical protein